MMKIFNDSEDKGVAIDLTKVEAIIQLDDGYVSIVTEGDTYRVKGDFECTWKAVEHEKDIRCV